MAKKSLLYSCLAVDSSAFSPFLLYFGEKVDYVLLVNCGEGEGRGIKMADRSSWRFVERRYFFDIFLKKFLKNKWIVWYGLVNWDQWINVDGKNVWYSTIYCLTSPENEKISTKFFSFFSTWQFKNSITKERYSYDTGIRGDTTTFTVVEKQVYTSFALTFRDCN